LVLDRGGDDACEEANYSVDGAGDA
jgi:hypothetical protein